MQLLKGLFIGFICLVPILLIGQDNERQELKNEFKINGLYLILGGIELDYEVILNEESSFGISAAYIFEDDSQYKWGITPHYRLFFGKAPASGFFVEGHGAIFSYESYSIDIFPGGGPPFESNNKVASGIGLAIGGKFITNRNVVVEINGGIGRIFGNDSFDTVYPRFGIDIGKRF